MAALSEVRSTTRANSATISPVHFMAEPSRYNIWAVGASLGNNFGPAQLTVGALDEVTQTLLGVRHS
jgi:hypothetical protein